MASEKKLVEVHNALANVVNKGGGAEYKADFDRLIEINKMYTDANVIQGRPERAIEVIKQIAPVKAERQRIADKYVDLLKQDTTESRRLQGILRHFDDVFGRFEERLTAFVNEAPAAIEKDINEALTMGQDAVQNKKHLFFGEQGGVKQRITWAKSKYDILAAAAPDSAQTKAAAQQIASAEEKVKQMRGALMEDIVKSNQPPQDRYNGPDKAQLVEIVKKKWAEAGLNNEVLKAGINSENWRRDTLWEWNGNTLSKSDKSRIQGHVVIKQDDNIAVVRHINLVKDHMAGDKISAYFFDDPKAAPDVDQQMLLSNVK
jgi:hypothetical protein